MASGLFSPRPYQLYTADTVVVGCPFGLTVMSDAAKAVDDGVGTVWQTAVYSSIYDLVLQSCLYDTNSTVWPDHRYEYTVIQLLTAIS